jgi:valyl-tRNA synthetase
MDMEMLQGTISDIRALRKDVGAEEKEPVSIRIHSNEFVVADKLRVFTTNTDIIERLAKVSKIEFSQLPLSGPNIRSSFGVDVQVLFERTIDVPAERERLTKELVKVEKRISSAQNQLNNPGFISKAPRQVVENLRKQLEEDLHLRDKLRRDLDGLSG